MKRGKWSSKLKGGSGCRRSRSFGSNEHLHPLERHWQILPMFAGPQNLSSRKNRNFRYDPNLRYSLPIPLADTSAKRRLLRPLSHRCVRKRRTGFPARRRDWHTFRVHGVHSQGTTDADTSLVGGTYEWIFGVGRRWHGHSPATGNAHQRKSRPNERRAGNASGTV